MSVTPATLTTVANSGAWASDGYSYIYDSTLSNGNHLYGRSGNGTSIDSGTEIQVDSNNNWSDYGTGTPAWAGVVGNEIVVRADSSSGPIRIKLVLPSSAPSSGSSGPTVTSITSGYIVTNDTVTNTDFTLLKNDSAYANTNISLTAATIALPSNAHVAGYTYNITYDGTAVYSRTVDSLSYHEFYWDDSWTSSPTSGRNPNSSSSRILNVIATIPSYITIGSGSDLNGDPNPLTTVFNNVSRVITYTTTATLPAGQTSIYINFALDSKIINGQSEIIGTFYESRTIDGYTNKSQDYIIGAQQTMTYSQSLLGDTITYSVSDWVYSDQPEGDGYVPVSTSSNGGGKPDRYPLIMTNLFNRNRSLYSIGMTHKDTWDLFL